jgi:hypothetical protein
MKSWEKEDLKAVVAVKPPFADSSHFQNLALTPTVCGKTQRNRHFRSEPSRVSVKANRDHSAESLAIAWGMVTDGGPPRSDFSDGLLQSGVEFGHHFVQIVVHIEITKWKKINVLK